MKDLEEYVKPFRIGNDFFSFNNVRWKDILEGRVFDTIVEIDLFGRIVSVEVRPLRLVKKDGEWKIDI
ncbi:MAG: hypothetical protein GWN01_16240 [Nitrosopumilaceae archaeon]|nr:hypothetical protein [Nitrosopumilaceae archaeon]NIU02387.1 hypothetical protein [Nitrosopumilaceae archaeon]NIU88844.1 hypothetical protein [Nitrosopumilaceae archaeon]NIV66968.1 hypothetical protein [Nitrosopumilaceae archaeon]NIX62988.1 hypothetical protein [Nitrosopumilaceae archaeon]